MSDMDDAIKPRERDAIRQALGAGVVPKLGLRHLQVGRAREIEELIKDINRIADGGASVRFIIGEKGSGKTFLLNLLRLVALERKLVVVSADLKQDRRLHATDGKARSLFNELAISLATRAKPEGGALVSIVERFIDDVSRGTGGETKALEEAIQKRVMPLQDLVSGFDFATALVRYSRAYGQGDETGKSAALRWLRAEYSSRTDARAAGLGVRDIIDDARIYDYLKLLAAFVKLAGYSGLLVVLDEMVSLYNLTNAQSRTANYEQILRIVNDVLQGSAASIGFLMGGTPEFLLDTRRGLYSDRALQSRLAENRFAREGLVDLSGPVVKLDNLSPEELFVLLKNIRRVFATGDSGKLPVPDEALMRFMEYCYKRIGEAYFRTPRDTVTSFVHLLAVLEQNPSARWQDLLERVDIVPDRPHGAAETPGSDAGSTPAGNPNDKLTTFRL